MSPDAVAREVDGCVVLRRDGVCVIVDLTQGRPPAIAHWGADLGELGASDVEAVVAGGISARVPGGADDPVRASVLPEPHAGWMGRPGIVGHRQGRDWSPKFLVSRVLVDGEPVTPTPDAPGAGTNLVVESVDPVAELCVHTEIELCAGGVLRCRAELTNTSAEPYQLDGINVALPVPPVASELLDFAGYWTHERTPQRSPFNVGQHVREGRRGRTGADAAFILHAGTPGFGFGSGEVWAVHLGWSGNHVHYAERTASGERVIGGCELLAPGEITLEPGASYRTPWLYGSYGVGLDEVARRFHTMLRARPNHPRTPRPVTLNVWEAVYFDHSLPPLIELAERAARVGVERFVLDDGWFGGRRDDTAGLGDWVVSPDVWPDGLHPLVDRVRDLGMQFGLWVEPEMINPDSDAARAHPEWIMATGDRQPPLARSQQVIDLTNPAAHAHVRDSLTALLAEYEIAYLKWDHNRDLIDAGRPLAGGRPGVHEQTLAAYRLMDELRAASPGLEIESCSSGGARVDLGVLEHTDRVWVSDCIDPHERAAMMTWTSQLLPPELLGSHIASPKSHTTGRTHDLDFRAAVALFGHLGVEWNLNAASEDELAQLADWIAFHKANRSLLHGGELVRVDFPDAALAASGVVAPDRSRALYSFGRLGLAQTWLLGRLRFPGLDPARRYRVRPVLPGGLPSGLRAPVWWGVRDAAGQWPGVELPGSVLVSAGLMDAATHPDHAVLYLAEAV